MINNQWTEEEIQILKDNHKYNDVFELSYMINRTRQQIWEKLDRFNLKCKKIDRTKYHNLNQVFIDYKRLLNNDINKFKTDYTLEYDILLFKYYLKINNIKVTKDFVYQIHFSKLLKDAKLYSRIKKKWHSCFDFISRCFPSMKLREYNFNTLQVREGFWNKDYNCFQNIKEGIITAFNDKAINSEKEILLFDLKLTYKYFHKSMIFFRGVNILEKYLTFFNIKHDRLKYYNGIRFDSYEELKVYKFISKYIQIVKNNKIYFRNKDTKYKPDFFIFFNDYKIIVEYFGMFSKKPFNEIYVNYKVKTLEKIEYFNSLNDYIFLDLYKEDINNNFEGVREKLTSLFMNNFNIDINKLQKEQS